MGRLLTLLLGAAVVFGVAYYAVTGAGKNPVNGGGPHQTLQNVRNEAKRIEEDAQKRADENFKKSDPQ